MQKLQISISCIITGLILKGFICQKFTRFFLAEKIYSSQTYMHFFLTLKEKQCMYMYYLLVNIKKVLSSNKYYREMKNNLAQFTVL